MQANKDPHHDAYLSELSLLVEPLKAFKTKVSDHLMQWPDNAILQRLRELADKLESLPMSAPLMKWLVGLETLLGKADEWETVASKEVSLKDEMHNLSRFVVRWRKLELESWSTALDRRHRDARKKTMQWWFHLHELIETAVKEPYWCNPSPSWITWNKDQALITKESGQVFDVLDQFARTATLGDFVLRIDLLESFANYVEANCPQAQTLVVTLQNLARYYRQFAAKVQDHLVKSREPIQQKLSDHVKIATWDDRNYFALRESAEKSHRVVHRLARAFDEVLESPAHPAMEQNAQEIAVFDSPEALATAPPFVAGPTGSGGKKVKRIRRKRKTSKKRKQAEAIENEGEDPAEEEEMGIDRYEAPFPLTWVTPTRIAILDEWEQEKTIVPLGFKQFDVVSVTRKAEKLIRDRVVPQLERRDDTTGRSAIDLDEDVRSRLRTLTKESPMQLKKRALVDFFSELKRHGVLEGIIPSQLRDSRLILATSMHLKSGVVGLKAVGRWDEAEDALYRCVAQMTRLRQIVSSPDRSPDLSQDESTRGLKACERMTLIALVQRELIFSDIAQSRSSLLEEVSLWSNLASEQERNLTEWKDDAEKHYLCSNMDTILSGVKDVNFLMRGSTEAGKIDVSKLVELQSRLGALVNKRFVSVTLRDEWLNDVRKEMAIVSDLITRSGIPSCETLVGKIDHLSRYEMSSPKSNNEGEGNSNEEKEDEEEFIARTNHLVETFMLSVQGLVKHSEGKNNKAKEDDDEDEDDEKGTVFHHDYLVGVVQSINLPKLVSAMQSVTSCLVSRQRFSSTPSSVLKPLLALLNPLVAFVDRFTNSFLSFHHSLCRFLQFALAVFRTLCAKGFCRPPEEEDEGGNQGGDEENLREGTGMGEGQGQTNVSKEMEDEEQLLGLKGEQEEQQGDQKKEKKDQEEEEDGMEMQNDFEGGEMHDVDQDDEDDDEKDDDDDPDKDEEEEELDREMGDVGEDNNVVDEKLWDSDDEDDDDDDGNDKQDDEEKFEKDAPMKGNDEDDDEELRAKDKDEQETPSKPPPPEKEQKKPKSKKDKEKDEAEEGDDDEGEQPFKKEEMEDHHGVDMKEEFTDDEKEDDEAAPEEKGEDTEGQDEGEEEEPEDLEMPPAGEDDDNNPPNNSDEDGGDDVDNESSLEDQEDDASKKDDEEDDENNTNKQIEGPEEDEEEPAEEGKLSLPAPALEPPKENQPSLKDDEEMQQRGNSKGQNASSSSNKQGDEQEEEEDAMDEIDGEEKDDHKQSGEMRGESGGTGGNKYRKGSSKQPEDDENKTEDHPKQQQQRPPQKKEPNPWRDPGDAAKEWTRRLKMVETGEDGARDEELGEEDEDVADEEKGGSREDLYEFNRANNEAEEEDLKQTLGAMDELQPKESQVKMAEEEDENKSKEEEDRREQQQQEPKQQGNEEKEKKPNNETKDKTSKSKKKNKKKGFFDEMEEEDEVEEPEEKTKPEEEEDEVPMKRNIDEASSHVIHSGPKELKDNDNGMDVEDEEEMQQVSLDEPNLSESQLEQGRKAWTEATNATHEMSQRLCEQLRLVLEPTTATKLKGDYRTGKRINMRRVIPFIASQFKKDKIWLRRTKPSRRKYHVALAIDDSKSMRPARQLALAALALISRALTQLEVGEVGVWSFGSQVRKLHDLSQPFGDSAGSKVAAQFSFDQESTCVEEGLGVVVEALTTAAQQSDGKSLSDQPRQLAFIVSDGRFDSGLRPRMTKWLRIARERRQLVALIVVEPPGGESILDLKQVSFGTGATMGMKVNRYLEDYPFPYYIVLRDMAVLPEVLADGLRQWFELIVGEDK